MKAEFLSHVGAVRKNNEDAVYCDVAKGIFAVADGVGGKQAGEIASAIAVKTVAAHFCGELEGDTREILREAFYEANNLICQAGKQQGLTGMGTTMTAALLRQDRIYIVHVGDSRAYLFNKEHIQQLTTDHSLVAELVRDGQISEEEAAQHPQRHVITRSLGQDLLVALDEAEISWAKGDYLLLCTDGLYNMLQAEEMREIALRAVDIRAAVEYMAELAYLRGGYDNISLILAAHE